MKGKPMRYVLKDSPVDVQFSWRRVPYSFRSPTQWLTSALHSGPSVRFHEPCQPKGEPDHLLEHRLAYWPRLTLNDTGFETPTIRDSASTSQMDEAKLVASGGMLLLRPAWSPNAFANEEDCITRHRT